MEIERENQLKQIIRCFDLWMSIKEKDINLMNAFFEKRSLSRIGIYGYGKLGKHLIREIKDAGFTVSWIADRRADLLLANEKNQPEIKLISPEEINETCDFVIVTTAGDMDSIERIISEKIDTRIIHIEEIINRVMELKEVL